MAMLRSSLPCSWFAPRWARRFRAAPELAVELGVAPGVPGAAVVVVVPGIVVRADNEASVTAWLSKYVPRVLTGLAKVLPPSVETMTAGSAGRALGEAVFG